MIHLDTHVLVWLYAGQIDRIPSAARRALDHEELAICPMVELELTYLYEIGRLRGPATDVLDELAPLLELRAAHAPFQAVVRRAVSLTWTRDPFDRLIAAHAMTDDAVLLTADETMRQHVPVARWE